MNILKNLIRDNILFLIIPITIVLLGILVGKINSSIFFINWDPDYAYLFNGLSIYSGRAPQHIDHPGATLQSLIASSKIDLYPSIIIGVKMEINLDDHSFRDSLSELTLKSSIYIKLIFSKDSSELKKIKFKINKINNFSFLNSFLTRLKQTKSSYLFSTVIILSKNF